MSKHPVRPAGSKPYCRRCRVETTVSGHSGQADRHPQAQTVALPGSIKGFVDCPGSGLPVLWLVPQEASR